jgi:hypothetical protein
MRGIDPLRKLARTRARPDPPHLTQKGSSRLGEHLTNRGESARFGDEGAASSENWGQKRSEKGLLPVCIAECNMATIGRSEGYLRGIS